MTDLSVLDHLKEAAIKLNISNTIQNCIDDLCEKELAYQINQHYQVSFFIQYRILGFENQEIGCTLYSALVVY